MMDERIGDSYPPNPSCLIVVCFLKVCVNIMFNVILIALEHCSRSFNYAMGRESQNKKKYELSNFTESQIFKSMTIIACLIHLFVKRTKELMLHHLSRSII